MNSMALDTHAYYKKLIATGLSETQAFCLLLVKVALKSAPTKSGSPTADAVGRFGCAPIQPLCKRVMDGVNFGWAAL